MEWGDWAFKLFKIPKSIMPTVVDSAGNHFGELGQEVLGHAVPIKAVMADQSAAVFGSGCFKKGMCSSTSRMHVCHQAKETKVTRSIVNYSPIFTQVTPR